MDQHVSADFEETSHRAGCPDNEVQYSSEGMNHTIIFYSSQCFRDNERLVLNVQALRASSTPFNLIEIRRSRIMSDKVNL